MTGNEEYSFEATAAKPKHRKPLNEWLAYLVQKMTWALWNEGWCGCFWTVEAAAGGAGGSWVAGSSSFVVAAPSGAVPVGSGVPCAGGWGAEGAAGPAGARGLGREEVLLDVMGGAAGSAVAADEEEAFGRMAANWKKMGKRRGGKTKQPVKTHPFLGRRRRHCSQPCNDTPTSQFTSKIEHCVLK